MKAAILALVLVWPVAVHGGHCVEALRMQAASDLGLDVQDVVVTLASTPLLSASSKDYTYRFASAPRGRVVVMATGTDGKTTSFTANVRVWGITLVAKHAIGRGAPLADSQFTIVRRDITDFSPVPRGSLAGQRARMPIPAGGVLTSERVEPIPVIHRGSDVTVVWAQGAIKVTRKGTALSDARMGDRLRVRIDGRTTIQSTVTGPNMCSVGI
jgi:flagella basal body P-ring formation protein FlgA